MSSVSETGTSRGVWRVSSWASSTGRVNLLLFVLLVASTLTTSGSSVMRPKDRQKRDIYQLCKMIRIYTGRRCVEYNNYGCFCGVDNVPGPPVDTVDSCCQDHDRCLDRMEHLCRGEHPHTMLYAAHCDKEKCTCSKTRTFMFQPVDLFWCEYNKCQCDQSFAWCLQHAGYNRDFKDNCPRLREGKK